MATISEALALAIQHHQAGRLQDAEQLYRQILAVQPEHADAIHLLGVVASQVGQHELAVQYIARAIRLKNSVAAFHNNLAEAYRALHKIPEAVACYRRALELKPDYAQAHNNRGAALNAQGKLDEAIACYQQALALTPDYAEAHNDLGVALKDKGDLDEAQACFRRALELKPDYAAAHSNLLYTQVLLPGCDPPTLRDEHRRWNRQHAEPLAKFLEPHANDRSPNRRLRVGYVSPDFCRHPVGRFLLPLLESHDHHALEIYCYASVRTPDFMTGRCRAAADVWRDVLGWSDRQVAELIRQDRIDILVDLTMHTANNRLLVFARKPAPVQVTYLAYCGTTGLGTIDYRLTDPYLDPPGRSDQFYSEQSVCLPETYWCYPPPIETPPVNRLPALEAGEVSFGSLNNFCKVSPAALAAWSRLLHAVPRSTLLLHAPPAAIATGCGGFSPGKASRPSGWRLSTSCPRRNTSTSTGGSTSALDTFPYGGGTTTCDALWMGVPVVSLAGPAAVGRGGVSLLSNVGLPELVAEDCEQYVQIAAELARDLPRLSALRATLRERMQASPLMNAPRFARGVEAAYRTMWQRWCDEQPRHPES